MLEVYIVSDEILAYGDIISSSVISFMGAYILYMVYTNQIKLHQLWT
ncbi:Nickel and cobalt efflux transporter rcnA [hydrothermal vent metagenome]|uniref:Nickel and cobalt efflux transporter rcnA n=1 Tax=hydrothermal vent metagenome TaxID=652676 RepID=A0A3B1DXZ2_9ZZZZ